MTKRSLVLVALLASLVAVPVQVAMASSPAGTGGGETVKIGLITPIESVGVSNPDDGDAFLAAIDYFNKKGGVGTDGLKLEGIVCDTHGDPNGEVACARQMVDEGVVATAGDLVFMNTAGVVEVLEEAGIPRIGNSAGDLAQFSSSVSYPVSAGPVGEFVAAAVTLAGKGEETVAMGLVESPQAGSLPGFVTPPFANAGIEFLDYFQIAEGSTDYARYVSEAQNIGADAVILATGEQQAAQFVAAMSQLNPEFRLAGLTPSFSIETLRENPDITKKMVLVNSLPYPSKNNLKNFPGLKHYFDAMKASGKDNLNPKNLTPNTFRPWMGVLGFVKVTADVQDFTKESVTEALETVQDVDLDGLIPPWTPSTPGYSIFEAISNHYVYIMKFNGKNVVTSKEPIKIDEYFEE